ncbi:eukaryotic aspartyl protease [Opisthorchis viverrini]|uniref:Eukaryotic aspartyl protease n=1 Tax=Opisthorchis viverrini TaxID=6198 RepID=A0A1S8WSP5_OPIVI|nr:eukaryotic aspartyl protease [Opisthorchis viverrini]
MLTSLQFSGASIANVIIGKVEEEVGQACSSNPFEGIVGLCYDTSQDEAQPTLMAQFIDKRVIERPTFSICEKRTNQPPGYLILGGVDPSFHVGELFYVDVNVYDPQLWTVMIDGRMSDVTCQNFAILEPRLITHFIILCRFQVGDSEFVEDSTFAVIDSGSPWIHVSPDALKEIHQIVKPIRFSDGFHFVDCSTMLQLPVIHFHLYGGQRLSLEPEYYVFKVTDILCVRLLHYCVMLRIQE